MNLRTKVWNTAVFSESIGSFCLSKPKFGKANFLIDNSGIRTEKIATHTTADPFLFVDDGQLFLFVESKRAFECGKISAYKTRDGKAWEHLGVVIDTKSHMSYPFVFRNQQQILMMPESSQKQLIEFLTPDSFPFGWKLESEQMVGVFCDSSIVRHNGLYYLFACPGLGETLEVFYSEKLDGNWTSHHLNPVVSGTARARNGGGPLSWNGELFRFAQNCARSYGEKLALFGIVELSPEKYAEEIISEDFLPRNKSWNRLGGHHFSLAEFNDQVFYAVDGRGYGHWANKPLGMLHRFLS